MVVREEKGGLTLSEVEHFSLYDTLECGQCFRWEALEEGGYRGIVGEKVLTLREVDQGCIRMEGTTMEDFHRVWVRYFDLERDYGAIRQKFAALDPLLAEAQIEGAGIRILRQEPWEALCSFIISANNHIPRIKEIIRRMCREFGQQLAEDAYTFPTAEVLARKTVEDLAPLRSGFRAKYILDAAQRVASGRLDLEKVTALPLADARAQLTSVYGVGDKVAECVLLFGMGRLEAFPMDVWMKRVMHTHYAGKGAEFFGEYAGLANQYLFFYSRSHQLKDDGSFAKKV